MFEKDQLKMLFIRSINWYNVIPIKHNLTSDPENISPFEINTLISKIHIALLESEHQFNTIRKYNTEHLIRTNRSTPYNSTQKMKRICDAASQYIDYEYIHFKHMYRLLDDALLISPETKEVLSENFNALASLKRLNAESDYNIRNLRRLLSFCRENFLNIEEDEIAANGKPVSKNNEFLVSTASYWGNYLDDIEKKTQSLALMISLEQTRTLSEEYIFSKLVLTVLLINKRIKFNTEIVRVETDLIKYLRPISVQEQALPLLLSTRPQFTESPVTKTAQHEKQKKYERHILKASQSQLLPATSASPQLKDEEELPKPKVKPKLLLSDKHLALLERFTNPKEISTGKFDEKDILTMASALQCACSSTKMGYVIVSMLGGKDYETQAPASFGFHRQHRTDVDVDRGVLKAFHHWLIEQGFVPENRVEADKSLKKRMG